jgi:uncharacterized protein
MIAFVDTSALYAALDADASTNARVTATLQGLLESGRAVTTSYVVVETTALVQRRLGRPAARALLEQVVPALEVEWVDADLHAAGATAMVGAGRRAVSLVDHVSFEVMRRRRIRTAVALDRHFRAAGFDVLPA